MCNADNWSFKHEFNEGREFCVRRGGGEGGKKGWETLFQK